MSKNESHNAYMREWNRKRIAAMTPEQKAAFNAKKCESARKLREKNPLVLVRDSEKTRRSLLKRLASLTPEEMADYRARKWAREQRRLESPEARAARRASAIRYNRSKSEKVKQYQKDYKVVLKSEMLAAYGSSCACCGEPETVFLTLDHIDGKGAAHRKAVNRAGGYAMYLYLKKQGWPKGFQVLCFNCNFAKKTGPSCPHEGHYLKLVTAPRNP